MFCSKCGAKNESGAKFCFKCGNKLEQEKTKKTPKKENNILKKLKDTSGKIPKKIKIGISIAIILILATIIILAILLNNPVKKVEDYLSNYYSNYKEDYGNDELIKIGEILKNNKDDKNTLENISKQIEKTINNWVKNFNKAYQNEEKLQEEYQKIKGILDEINRYFNGLEYVLTYENYYSYYEEIYTLYNSKSNYFSAVKANNDYDKYRYYNQVIKEDSYYKEAEEFVKNYLSDELETLKTEAEKLIYFDEFTTNEEKLNAYISQLKYLRENSYQNGIDLSETEDYINLYNNAVSKIVEYTKTYAEELDKNLETNKVIDIINSSLAVLENNTEEYEELEELKDSYENKMPDSLVSKYVVSHSSGTNDSSYQITIDDQDYDSYLSFSFKGETLSRVYRLNNKYKTFKATIVRGPDWNSDFKGEIIIYGDNKELYRSGEITKTNEFNSEINIEITDIDDLKIEFVTESKTDSYTNFYIYLVEPYLYK